ncbi:MAG TPA: hypothetical protein GX699_02240 [Firmicutes bacterium]|nr:hypothetical protein [Bacillota bacterium]
MSGKGLLTVLDPKGQPSGIFGRVLDPKNPHAILDPDLQPTNNQTAFLRHKMADRLDTLEGKTIYLVDTGFAGAADFMAEIEGWFRRNMPCVKTVVRQKRGNMFTDDPELWEEIGKHGDAAIVGVGG